MPKLKFKDFMLDDENTPVKVPVSNTYTAKRSIVAGHGLSALREILHSIESTPTPTPTPAPQPKVEAKPKRKYTKRKPFVKKIGGIKDKALAQVIATLDAINCTYKIVTDDNQVFTRGVVFSGSETKKRKLLRPHGMVAAHYKPYIVGMKVGDTALIPPHKELPPDVIQSSATAWMAGSWGKGSYNTMIDAQNNIQVLRIR